MGGEKIILGLTEEVFILGSTSEKVVARIDTGATSSSLDLALARKLGIIPSSKVRVVKSASGIRKRPLAVIRVKMSGSVIEAEFSLADRSHMTYAVLIGQNILRKGNFLIDPTKT